MHVDVYGVFSCGIYWCILPKNVYNAFARLAIEEGIKKLRIKQAMCFKM